ncbi:MAG: TonB-dependent receptor, partial [Pseudomonadota bacterium]
IGGSLAPAQAQDETSLLEEIIVTARKKSESLQDIPLSVSAFSGEQIVRRAYRDLRDIAMATSGLEYEDFATAGLTTAPVIRGMGQTFTTSRIQNTGVFLDGLYLQRQSMVNPGLLDVERIEVLKGPQNAQYGRNAFAGAINYITTTPPYEFEGEIGATIGDGERQDLFANIGGPIIDDVLFGRISAGVSEFDGHTENHHPFADDGPSGDLGTDGDLGGWDDESYSVALDWTPTERLRFGFQYNHNESVREPNGFYYLNGARYVLDTNEIESTPPFSFIGPTAANCLDTVTSSSRWPFPIEGNHAYCGELPYDPPVLDDQRLEDGGFADTAGNIVVDPRSNALDSESKIFQFNVEWEISEAWSARYQYGNIEHEASNVGTVSGRSSLVGSLVGYAPVQELDEPPFLIQTGPPGFFGATEDVSLANANPIEELESESHELRFTWDSESVLVRLGAYYSKNEDQDGSIFYFTRPCNNVTDCGIPKTQSENPLDPRFIDVEEDPDDPSINVGVPHPFANVSGLLGNLVEYEDTVIAFFADANWDITDSLSLTIEARYTEEDKSYNQLSGPFGVEIPQNDPMVQASDDDTYYFFTPRVTVDYAITDFNMLYALYAEGVKTGGFNAVNPLSNPEQANYDEEKQTTYEIGTKNQFFDGKLTLNAAFYYIDWKNVQGTEAAATEDAFDTDVVGNIGDATVTGFEIDGAWLITPGFYADYALAFIDPEYDDATYQSSVNTTDFAENSSWGCNDIECRSDGNVDGNQVERTSKRQASIGFNFDGSLGADWTWAGRIDFNYRSKMYATPLNLAHNGSRMVSNANLNFNNGNLDITLWGKNIFDEEYVANSFVLPSFNRYIVSQGAPRTVGMTLKYLF